MKSLKICLINPFSKPAAIRQYNLAKSIAEQGHKVTLILPKFDKYSGYKDMPVKSSKNLEIIHPFQIRSKNLELSMIFYFTSLLRKTAWKKFDIVHGFRPTPFSGYMAYKISRRKRIPFVLEMGDIEWETMKALKTHPRYRIKIIKMLENFLIKRADGITTMSPTLSSYFEKMYGRKVKTITSGIDTKFFSSNNKNIVLRKQLEKLVGNKKIMMYVGKLDKSSHVKDMIKVLDKVNNVGLVIVGEGNGKQELIDIASRLKVGDRCYFAGRVDHKNIPKYLNAADILAAPFAKDTVGAEFILNLKILEYMGMEKPIIVSKIGILKDFLKDCAFLYNPGDIDDFAKQIKIIFSDKKKTNLVSKAARKKILNYDWKILAKEMVDYYKEIIYFKTFKGLSQK